MPAPFGSSTVPVTKPLLVCSDAVPIEPSKSMTTRVNKTSNLFILRNSFWYPLRILGGCLIAWGANEIGFTPAHALTPNFRSACESNRIKTCGEGARDVPATQRSGQARSSLARPASSQAWLMNLDL